MATFAGLQASLRTAVDSFAPESVEAAVAALGDAPLSLLDTDTGADEVRKLLAAIAYGGVA